MNWIIKKAITLSEEQKSILGLVGIPLNWPIEILPYSEIIPEGFELISEEDLILLKVNNQASYDSWLASKMMAAPVHTTTKVEIISQPLSSPFARKILDDGGKLYRRKKGIRKICDGNLDTVISYVIPYTKCKIDEIEIINCSGNDCGDFIVKDSEAGTYSGEPNKILNQFGFDVCFSDLYYSDSSQYDAELYQGMQVEIIFKNKDADSKNIGVNLTLHEIKYT